MSAKLKSSLPGIFSLVLVIVFILAGSMEVIEWDAVTWIQAVLATVAGLLGIAWVPPELPDQHDDTSLKGNLPGIMTAVVFATLVTGQISDAVPLEAVDYVVSGLALVASWLGLPWVPPKLPAQSEEGEL